jgi:serine/threonine-protein kinase
MGEVYRADDLKLGQAVALKFLPKDVEKDEARLTSLLNEVKLARQISHPGVCRVYDVGEVDGQHFLSMEYVDGEDLASLLRRIGRLPTDKALDIARQISAGLASAHERGILHRDLKPANVMLDGRGRVRIMDFGLAVAADVGELEGDSSGTPAYMAPEQLAGGPASVRTDIYALGLVLYELYTGKRAFVAASLDELRARMRQSAPPAPSELIRDMDPAVERVILRALARDPGARQASVAQIAAALPGGSLLEAALKAGDTPSPEMVAASGTQEGLEPPLAWALLALVVAGAVAAAALGSKALLWRRAALERSPDTLAEKARETLVRFGYSESPADHAAGFEADVDYLRYLQRHDHSRSRWDRADPGFFRFWYRQSPHPLESWRFPFNYGNFSRVGPTDPPLDLAGMALVRLDPSGRLVQLVVVPPPVEEAAGAAPTPDWPALLVPAGFEPSTWKPVAPRWTPPVYTDARAAWEGTWPNRPDVPVRLEAGAFRGKPVYFEAFYPWTRPPRTAPSMLTAAERAGLALTLLMIAAMFVVAAIFAQRNVRAGRGDRRGAFRLSAFVFAAVFISWFFGEKHVTTLWEVALLVMASSWALFTACLCWLGYLAAEPLVRRRWPDVLVSWARLLAGEFRDPLVGRDVLIGCATGPVLAVIGFVSVLLPGWLGLAPDLVPADVIGVAYGLQRVVPLLVWRLAQSVITALAALFLVFFFRLVLRRSWVATSACVLLTSAVGSLAFEHFWVALLASGAATGVLVLVLLRVGLLATVVAFYTSGLFIMFPVTGELSAWYAGAGVTALLVLALLALFGFTAALGGRPALGVAALEG